MYNGYPHIAKSHMLINNKDAIWLDLVLSSTTRDNPGTYTIKQAEQDKDNEEHMQGTNKMKGELSRKMISAKYHIWESNT
jgi:hypothetical protein